jgi:hypothetical protein
MPSPWGFTRHLDIQGPCNRLVKTSEIKPMWPIRLLEGWVVWSSSPLNWHLKCCHCPIGLSIGVNFVLPMRLLELVPPFCLEEFCLDYWTKLNVTMPFACGPCTRHAKAWEAFSTGIWKFEHLLLLLLLLVKGAQTLLIFLYMFSNLNYLLTKFRQK